jgi:hypothetical protein
MPQIEIFDLHDNTHQLPSVGMRVVGIVQTSLEYAAELRQQENPRHSKTYDVGCDGAAYHE